MAKDLVVRLNGDSKGFNSAINSAKESLKGIEQEGSKLDSFQQRFEKITNSTKPMKKQLADLRGLLAEMNQEGLNTSNVFTQIAQKAGSLADNIGDAQTAVKAFSNDTMNLQASVQAFELVAAGGALATGAMAMFGTENEKATLIIQKVQGALAMLNGVQTIANLLNKDSVLMLKLKQIQMNVNTASTNKNTIAATANNTATAVGKVQITGATVATTANTVAKAANTTATTAATVAQTAWNKATAIAKAMFGDVTGLILLATAGITAYSIATAGSTDKTEESTKAIKNNEKTLSAQERVYKSFAKSAGDAIADVLTKYDKLKRGWEELRTTTERNEFIKQNTSAFNDLGLSINSIIDAENAFVRNTAAVVQALEDRAKAKAAEEVYTEALKKQIRDEIDREANPTIENGGERYVVDSNRKFGEQFSKSDYESLIKEAYGGGELQKGLRYEDIKDKKLSDNDWQKEWIEQALKVVASKREVGISSENSRAVQVAERMFRELEENAKRSAAALNGTMTQTTTTTQTTTPKTQLENDRDALKAIRDKVQSGINDFNDGLITKETLDKTVKEANDYFTENKIKSKVELEYKTDENGFEKASFKSTKPQAQKEELDLVQQLEMKYKELIKTKRLLLTNNPEDTKGLEDLNNQIDETLTKLKDARINLGYDTQATSPSISNNESDWFSASSMDKRESYSNALSVGNSAKEAFNNGIIDQTEFDTIISDLNEKLRELELPELTLHVNAETGKAMDNVDEFRMKYEKLSDASNSIGKMGSAFETLGNAIGGATGQIMSFGGTVISQGAQLMSQLSQIIVANQAATMSEVATGAARLSFPFSLAAIAAGVATVASIFASFPKFAEGGIVGGNSYYGDKILARVNSGELLLNHSQQASLYEQLNRGNSTNMGGSVNFRIVGSDLVGVLNNYNKKMNRIR